MGSITSRGKDWPPKPYKRVVVTTIVVRDPIDGEVERTVDDYVWVYPGAHGGNSCGGSGAAANWKEEISPGQENAIRDLEGG